MELHDLDPVTARVTNTQSTTTLVSMEEVRTYYWAIISPSAQHSVAYLDSRLATDAAADLKCGQYLVLVSLSTNELWTSALAYFVQSAQLPLPAAYLPIFPCRLGLREPLVPDFEWPFGECVVDTGQRLVFEPVPLKSEVAVPRPLSEDASRVFAARSAADGAIQLEQEHLENCARKKAERESAGLPVDEDARWTTFSRKSTVPDAQPGQFFPATSIYAYIHHNIESLRELLQPKRCLDEVKDVQRWIAVVTVTQDETHLRSRLRARFSRLETERTILWTRKQAPTAPSNASEHDPGAADFDHPALLDFSTSFERPISPDRDESLTPTEGVEDADDDDDLDDWWGGQLFGIHHAAPAAPSFEPQSLQLIYFDVYGTLIDSESGIFRALGPLLGRSSYGFDRREALSMYFDVEGELKQRLPSTVYSEILAQAHQEMALRLGLTSTPDEASTFASSLINWPLFDGVVQSLYALQSFIPNLKLVPIVDLDIDTLYETNVFPIITSYFSEIWSWDLCHTYRPDEHTLGPAVAYHDRMAVPRPQRLLVSNALFGRLELGCQLLVPAVWIRNPAALAGNLPSADASFVWKVVPDLAGVVSVIVEGNSALPAPVVELKDPE